MQRLINTARFVMYLGTNRIAGKVNGTSNAERHERQFLEFEWIEMSVLDRDFYHLVADTVFSSHEYYNNLAVEAAVLSAKHYWAAHVPEPEVVDNAAGVPPLEQQPSRSFRGMPPPEVLGLIICASEFLLTIFKRSGKNAVSKDRHTLALIWLTNLAAIALGIAAAYRLYECRLPWPDVCLKVAYGIFALGMAVRWYAIIYLGRFFTTNVAIASDHRVIDNGPYRFVRHPSYAGGLLALLGLSLSFQNWACLLIIFVPCFAANAWRIQIEEKALAGGLGEPYRKYVQRTKRLIPFVY